MVSCLRFLMNSKNKQTNNLIITREAGWRYGIMSTVPHEQQKIYRQIILFQRIYYLSISLTGLPCHRQLFWCLCQSQGQIPSPSAKRCLLIQIIRFCLQKGYLYGYSSCDAAKAESLIYLPGFHVCPAQDAKTKKFAFKIYHASAYTTKTGDLSRNYILAGDLRNYILAGDLNYILAGDLNYILAGDLNYILAGDLNYILAGDLSVVFSISCNELLCI